MKRYLIAALVMMGVTGFLTLNGYGTEPMMAPPKEGGEGIWRGPIYFDHSLQFEAKAHRETIPTERKEEAVRLHQSMLLDRFQGADAQGEVFLSFSVDRIKLMTRSIAGVEAPAVGLSLTPEK